MRRNEPSWQPPDLWPPLAKAVLLFVALQVLVATLDQIRGIVLLVATAGLIAVVLMPLVDWLEAARLPLHWHLPRWLAVLLIYFLAFMVLSLLAYLLVPILIDEVRQLATQLPNYAAVAQDWAISTVRRYQVLAGVVAQPLPPLPGPEAFFSWALTVFSVGALILGGLLQTVVTLVLALYLVVESQAVAHGCLKLFPRKYRPVARDTGSEAVYRIGRWGLGRVVQSLIVGALTGIGMLLIGLPFPLLLGVFFVLVEFAPIVGPDWFALPLFLLGLTQSLFHGIAAAIFIIALTQFAANVLTPLLQGSALKLSPALLIPAVLIGGALYGALGALLAMPAAAILQIALERLYPEVDDAAREAVTDDGEERLAG